MSARSTRFVAILLTLCAALPATAALTLATAAPASAASYRYWTYWWGRPDRTAWQYASLGPASDSAIDGWVLGWRFQVTSPTGGGAQAPRTSSSYSDLCSDPAPGPDQVRVAVVVDYGDASTAPPGEQVPSGPRTACVVVPAHSHGSDVMRAASVSLRFENGFVCGINGYPSAGCATAVGDSPTPTPTPTRTSTPTPTRTSSAPATAKPTPSVKPSTASASRSQSASLSHSSSPSPSTTSAAPTPRPSNSVTAIASTGGAGATPTAPSPTTTPVGTVIATAPTKVTESRNAFGLIAGIAGIALLAGSAWFTSRRRGGAR